MLSTTAHCGDVRRSRGHPQMGGAFSASPPANLNDSFLSIWVRSRSLLCDRPRPTVRPICPCPDVCWRHRLTRYCQSVETVKLSKTHKLTIKNMTDVCHRPLGIANKWPVHL